MSASPLVELLPEHIAPELLYLQSKWSSLMSYGLTVKALRPAAALAQANASGIDTSAQPVCGLGHRHDRARARVPRLDRPISGRADWSDNEQPRSGAGPARSHCCYDSEKPGTWDTRLCLVLTLMSNQGGGLCEQIAATATIASPARHSPPISWRPAACTVGGPATAGRSKQCEERDGGEPESRSASRAWRRSRASQFTAVVE